LLRFSSTHTDDEHKRDAGRLRCADAGRSEGDLLRLCRQLRDSKSSPQLELLRKRGVEALLLHERLDDWLMTTLAEFADKRSGTLRAVKLELPGNDDESKEESSSVVADKLMKRLKAALQDKVAEVRRSKRLTTSPACLVLDEHAMGAQMRASWKPPGNAFRMRSRISR